MPIIKHSTPVKVSSMIVTFINRMGIDDYESKRQEYHRTEKKVQEQNEIYVQNLKAFVHFIPIYIGSNLHTKYM